MVCPSTRLLVLVPQVYMSRFSRVGIQSSPKNLRLRRAMVTCTSYKADGHTRLYCKVKSYTPRFVEFVPCLATYGIADLSRSSLICIRSTRYKIVLDISRSSRQVYHTTCLSHERVRHGDRVKFVSRGSHCISCF